MGIERRQSPRKDCLKIGTLVSCDHADFWDCLVWNVSQGGVMVELDPDFARTAWSSLYLPALNIHRSCQRVWQQGRRAGLQFMDRSGPSLGLLTLIT